MLRHLPCVINIDTAQVLNSDDLKEYIKEKLGDHVKECDYTLMWVMIRGLVIG